MLHGLILLGTTGHSMKEALLRSDVLEAKIVNIYMYLYAKFVKDLYTI